MRIVVPGLVVAAALALGGLFVLVRQSRTRPSSLPLPVAAFPLALLLLVAPVLLVAIQTIRDFQAIGVSGQATFNTAAGVAMSMVRPAWAGCFGFVVILAVANVLDWFGMSEVDPAEAGQAVPKPWAPWIATFTTSLLVPAASLVYFARNTAGLMMEIAAVMKVAVPGMTIAGLSVDRVSQMMANRLVLATLGGGSIVVVVLGASVAAVAAHRFGSSSVAMTRVSRVVTIVGGIVGIWLLVLLTIDIRSIARAAAASVSL
ncbi:MAG TPA: hypothetical protein VN700_15290 [Vicinamibacterales bacterium]|nr:hypothetical protein [Vicinamibacterales bacterium]